MTNQPLPYSSPLDPDRQAIVDAKTLSRKLRVEEAAEYLSLAVSTLNKLRMRGLGPCYIQLTCRRVAYDLSDLEAWVDPVATRPLCSSVHRRSPLKGVEFQTFKGLRGHATSVICTLIMRLFKSLRRSSA